MFRRIISTSASWTPVPLRLALAAVFIAHGAQKVLGRFAGPGLAKFTSIPAALFFHASGVVVDGRRGVRRVDWRRAVTAGIAYTSWRLPDCLRHANGNRWGLPGELASSFRKVLRIQYRCWLQAWRF